MTNCLKEGVPFYAKGVLNKRYTGECKQIAIEYMLEEKMGGWQAGKAFGMHKSKTKGLIICYAQTTNPISCLSHALV